MKVWRKQSTKYILNGKRVAKGTPGAKRIVIESKRFYGTLRLACGQPKQTPLTEDKATSKTLLRRLQTQEDDKRANGVTRYSEERKRPLSELVDEYATHLRSKENTATHVALTVNRIRSLLDATQAKTLADVDAGRIANTLAEWRRRKKRPLSVVSSNHYARAIKSFTRWLWTERRTSDDSLSSLRLLNADAHLKRQRRALTPDELRSLVKATRESGVTIKGRTWRMSPTDRAMLYTLAAYTGLRASELASLTVASFDLEAKTVNVQAAYSKRRRNDTLPLHASLVEQLRPWLGTKTGRIFPGTWTVHYKAAKLLRKDLARTGIAYIDATGRYADFHSLRHTFVTQLARANIAPVKAKELARHSTITLTLDVYSHVERDELREALDTLPPLE